MAVEVAEKLVQEQFLNDQESADGRQSISEPAIVTESTPLGRIALGINRR